MGEFRRNSGGFGGRAGGRSSGRSFERRDGFRDRDSGFGRDRPRSYDRRPLEKFKVICDKCKKECEVPFKPTSGKPIYCKECFDIIKPISPQGISGEQINQINEKLDKIMRAMKIT